jgi:hypothetical protein
LASTTSTLALSSLVLALFTCTISSVLASVATVHASGGSTSKPPPLRKSLSRVTASTEASIDSKRRLVPLVSTTGGRKTKDTVQTVAAQSNTRASTWYTSVGNSASSLTSTSASTAPIVMSASTRSVTRYWAY